MWRQLRGTPRKGGPATGGYVLIRRRPYRNWYLHRAIADLLTREWNPYGWDGLPGDVEVHHLDGRRSHNCPQNLLILPPAIHHALQRAAPRCPWTGRYISAREYEVTYGARGAASEVPF